MKLDCYGVLGLSPTAEDVVIRAAYLALMRSYHPDRNPSAEAAARARAITEAYKTIGDPARRAEYDASRWEHQFEILGYEEEVEPQLWRKAPLFQWPRLSRLHWPSLPKIRWPKAPAIRWSTAPEIRWPKAPAIGAVAASGLAIVLALMVLPMIPSGREGTPRPQPSTAPTQKAVAVTAALPERTTQPKPPSELVAAVPSTPTEAGPPPAPTAETLPEKAQSTRSEPAIASGKIPVAVRSKAPPEARQASLSSPRSAGQSAPSKSAPVDQKARVAALESMSTSFYNQSLGHADDARRSQLQQARDLFVNARNACRSDSCVGDAHASYIRDISQIMQRP